MAAHHLEEFKLELFGNFACENCHKVVKVFRFWGKQFNKILRLIARDPDIVSVLMDVTIAGGTAGEMFENSVSSISEGFEER